MKLKFIGCLPNVDSTILKVKLGNEFTFNSFSDFGDYRTFLLNLNKSEQEIMTTSARCDLLINRGQHNPKRDSGAPIVYVERIYDSDEKFSEYPPDTAKLMEELRPLFKLQSLVQDYLVPKLELLRLFKDGDVMLPIGYYFRPDSFKLFFEHEHMCNTWDYKFRYHTSQSLSRYSLNENEIIELQKFLDNTTRPFMPHLELALDSFNISYHISDENLAFLSLMNGLEALFNDGGSELTHRIARACAVLLGKDRTDASSIYEDIKKLYRLRSSIVHANTKINVEDGNLQKLRDYVRRAIKLLIKSNLSKTEILKNLNMDGFGSSALRKQ